MRCDLCEKEKSDVETIEDSYFPGTELNICDECYFKGRDDPHKFPRTK